MEDIKKNILKLEINEKIFRLLSFDNKDLLILLEQKVLYLNNPDYKLENALEIRVDNLNFYEMGLWKNNHILLITLNNLYLVQLDNKNKNYRIVLKLILYNNINTKFRRFIQIIPLINISKFLLNSYGKFLIYREMPNNSFQSEIVIRNPKSFQSFIQIKKNEIVCNSENEKKVYFININKGKILSKINDLNSFILDRDIFCLINEKILAMAGELRSGIYFFDINKRELIYHYKSDWRGYHCLLNIGKNKFLGESYDGRVYAESDDEEEELLCTKYFEFNEKENNVKFIKNSNNRIAQLRRHNFIKFKGIERIAYVEMKNVHLEYL